MKRIVLMMILAAIAFPVQLMAATGAKKIDLESVLPSSGVSDIYFKYEKFRDEMKRGEFEKKADFEKRVASLAKDKVDVFFIEITDVVAYDVDNEKFSGGAGLVFSGDNLQIRLARIEKYLGSYEASNSFGVKKEISKISYNTFEIEALNINGKSKFIKDYSFTLFFNCPPEKAQVLKPHLKLVGEFIPSLRSKGDGFTYENSSYHDHDPTLSEPYEISGSQRTLYVKAKNFHFINGETGEIIKSFPF